MFDGDFFTLLRYFYRATALSIILAPLTAKVALSIPTTAPQYPQQRNADVLPLCYMQTVDGRIVDLQRLCSQSSPANTTSAVDRQAPPRFRLSSGSGYASDSRREDDER